MRLTPSSLLATGIALVLVVFFSHNQFVADASTSQARGNPRQVNARRAHDSEPKSARLPRVTSGRGSTRGGRWRVRIADLNNTLTFEDIRIGERVANRMLAFHSLYHSFPPTVTVNVRLFKSFAGYRRFRDDNSTITTDYGFYLPSRDLAVVNGRYRYQSTYLHEIQHAIFNKGFYRPPRWLNEGLSELFEWVDVSGGGVYALRHRNKFLWLKKWQREERLPDLRTWVNQSTRTFTERDVGRVRRGRIVGWGIAYFMLSDASRRRALARMIRDLKSGALPSVAAAFDRHYGSGLGGFIRDFNRALPNFPPRFRL